MRYLCGNCALTLAIDARGWLDHCQDEATREFLAGNVDNFIKKHYSGNSADIRLLERTRQGTCSCCRCEETKLEYTFEKVGEAT